MNTELKSAEWLFQGFVSFKKIYRPAVRLLGSGRLRLALLLAMLALLPLFEAGAARIKEIADIKGVRDNQLVGYGLVVGLDGSGDGKKAMFTVQSMVSMLEKMGITVNNRDINVSNVAAVMVTADLPPFAKSGGRIDTLVSSIGDAKSLQGGTLLLTPLKGANGQVYAVAQGPVNTGGFSAQGAGGTSVQKNFPTVGRVIGGALIEREINLDFNARRSLTLSLHQPDFTTASRIVEAINKQAYGTIAMAPDAGTVQLDIPQNYTGNVVELVARIEKLEVRPDAVARVVINERTGTVVMGDSVRIDTVAVAHGNLNIMIKTTAQVSQPAPFSEGETVVTPDTNIEVDEGQKQLVVLPSGTSIGEVVRALNALGVSPRDLIAIFQAIKAAGALQADLEVI